MRTINCAFLFMFVFSMLNAQNPKVEPIETGIYQASWESLKQYGEAPEWFQNAKFGIWAHWGPQCEPEDGDWYARYMYYPGQRQYKTHIGISDTLKIDGVKFFLSDKNGNRTGWVLIRESGTEPLLRFYIETSNMENMELIKRFIGTNV